MLRQRIQLSLIHLAVAIALVPMNSTLNRVMIKEQGLSATLVALLASLPYIFSPLQIAIGSYSDRHPVLGYRRSPYIALGLILCVLGVVAAPYAVFEIERNPALGLFFCVLAFGGWGMGFNLASVTYLSLASELSGEKGRSRTVSIMWFVMITGIIITSIGLSRMLEEYSHERLAVAFQVVALASLVLGMIGLFRLEPRSAPAPAGAARRGSWQSLIRGVLGVPAARHFFFYLIILLAALLGQDVLLEPYAGQIFHLPVSATTRITSIWGVCVLVTLLAAGWLEQRITKQGVAWIGGAGGAAAFLLIAASGLLGMKEFFYAGVVLLGLATGLSTVANLSLMFDMTTARVGMFIGAWGVADALARMLGGVVSGVVRDVAAVLFRSDLGGYAVVYFIDAALMAISLVMLSRIDVRHFREQAQLTIEERAALMQDT